MVAASAADSGHDVTVCVRTPIDSLVLETEGESRKLPVAIAARTEDVGPGAADVVFLTTKVTDDAGTAPWLAELCAQETILASVQNGLDHESRLAPFVPAGTVVPALAYVAAERLAPGRIRYLAGDRVVVPTRVEGRLSEVVSGEAGGAGRVGHADGSLAEALRQLGGQSHHRTDYAPDRGYG